MFVKSVVKYKQSLVLKTNYQVIDYFFLTKIVKRCYEKGSIDFD